MSVAQGAYLSDKDIKEQLSYAYIHALSSRIGFQCACLHHPDRDSIDAQISGRGLLENDSTLRSPVLHLQLKAKPTTIGIAPTFSFQVARKNYDDLRQKSHVPKLLVVFIMPMLEQDWLCVDSDHMITRKCAYWHNLLGEPSIVPDTQGSKSVNISTSNLLDMDSLRKLMVRVSREEAIGHAL